MSKKPRRSVPVKKPVKPARPAHSASASARLHPVSKRSGQRKASASAALHQVKPKPVKPVKPSKPRQYSPGSDVACCSAEALGTLLGLGWEDVLALYWRTARDPDAGASILATLKEGQEFGKGRPSFTPVDLPEDLPGGRLPVTVAPDGDLYAVPSGHALILGVTLPEPHAVAVTPDGRWWSWGEPFSPGDWPELVVEETWAVLL